MSALSYPCYKMKKDVRGAVVLGLLRQERRGDLQEQRELRGEGGLPSRPQAQQGLGQRSDLRGLRRRAGAPSGHAAASRSSVPAASGLTPRRARSKPRGMTMRPILLTNATLCDPATGRQAPGHVLVRDGLIQDVGWGPLAGVPDEAETDRLRGPRPQPRPHRPARLRGRARRRASRDPGQRQRGGGGRRRHDPGLHAGHQPGHRRAGHRRLRAAPRPRHGQRPRPAGRRHHQGPRRPGDDRVRPAAGGRRRRLHRRPQGRDQRPGHAPRADLCPRLRRPADAARGGAGPRRRRRDERGRDGLPPRAPRHPARGRDGDAGARHPPRAPHRRPLPRGDDLLCRFGRDRAPGQGGRAAGHLRRLGEQPRPQRGRHRRTTAPSAGSRRPCATRPTGSPWWRPSTRA